MVGNIGLLVNVDIARQKSFKIASKMTKLLINILIIKLRFAFDVSSAKKTSMKKSSDDQVAPNKNLIQK